PANPRILTVGTNVVWTYLVSNPGSVPLTVVSVRDDNGTPNVPGDDFSPRYVSGDADNDGLLDPGETWLYTSAVVVTYTVQPNLYGNLGSVAATTPGGQTITAASDPSYHLGNVPTLFILKAINAADPMHPTPAELAQAAPGRPLPVGTPVVWTYQVTDVGDAPVKVTSLRDDAGTPSDPADDFSPTPVLQAGINFNIGDTNTNGLLDPGEVWLYSSAGTKSGTTVNWDQVYQYVLDTTDTSGGGATPGFVHDPVNSQDADNIFTGGQSKDT